MFFLGNLTFGTSSITGPTAINEGRANTFARHDVIRGKPVLQLIGEELDTKEIRFFFDERFCEPEAQWLTLWAAYKSKTAMPMVAGASFDGTFFVVEKLDRDIQKTTRSGGRVVRLEATMSLLEAPIADLLGMASSAAVAVAGALGSAATKPDAVR